ncbi:LacI family DNA-binding transcriptional regulator [Thermostaphylospora chromogena]|uniref:Transcriptional regulator, LacI family n=1 Tax=Thermostaphylospora chromogena TaxID=35622 RepID=A0A1H1A391_9ACTN|nr:LacI family DNA-binding transcriptional regulator [Thermostaphylospora chromogena]SDQ34108.1 transcriptional regulator, LacI family [Thermostaphylospora chromogena]
MSVGTGGRGLDDGDQQSPRPTRRRGGRPGGGRATISRVADVAGVSRATVSRVMNGTSTVAPELVARVRAAAEALDYEPSPVARSLALGRTSTVSLIVPDLANPMFQDVLRGLSAAAGEAGHRLLVAESNENVEEESILAVEARRRSDGLVLASPRAPEAELRALSERLTPLVLLNREIPGSNVPSLSVDYAAGIREIVAHLLGYGHRHLVYLAGPDASTSNQDRVAALRAAAAADGFKLTELPCGAMFEDGHAVARAALDTGATAIVAYNDMVAFGTLSGLHELGVSVPRDISITGFDDIPFARYTTPPLTTASIPRNELGRQAWGRLWALMNGEPAGHNVRFQPRLLVRDSTGPVPEAGRQEEP